MGWFGKKADSKKASDVKTPPPKSVTPAPDIPVLREKKKEKKGAGIPWYAGSGAGGPGAMIGGGVARVGSGGLVSQWGFLGSQRIAMTLANFFGRSTMMGGMFAGKMGGAMVLTGMLGWGGLLAVAGMKAGGVSIQPRGGLGDLVSLSGAGRSGIVIDAPKDRSLDYLAHANTGEIVWDKESPMAPKDAVNDEEEEVEAPEGAAQEEAPAFEMPDVSALMGKGKEKAKLADGFTKGLTSSLSGFSGGGPRMKSNNFNLKKQITTTPKFSQKGKLAKFKKRKMKPAHGSMSKLRGKSDRAMGQLKLARTMSRTAIGAADQGAKAFSADAFDQGQTIGGELSGIEGEGIVVPPGSGAPDGLANGAPDVGPGTNVTPYQGAADAAESQSNSAQGMKATSIALIAAGTAMLLAATKAPFPANIILAMIGGMLMAAGAMMAMMAGQMGDNAKKQGDQIEDQYGQPDQSDVIDNCADQASQNNVATQNCTAPNPSGNVESHTNVREAVEAESTADFTLVE